MIFINTKPIKSLSNISFFQKIMKYEFPKNYIECIKKINGGSPKKFVFDTEKETGRCVCAFLSFNPDDILSVWNYQNWCKTELGNDYVVFACDNFGNLICFDREDDKVVFIDIEKERDERIENVAESFDDFLSKLYD